MYAVISTVILINGNTDDLPEAACSARILPLLRWKLGHSGTCFLDCATLFCLVFTELMSHWIPTAVRVGDSCSVPQRWNQRSLSHEDWFDFSSHSWLKCHLKSVASDVKTRLWTLDGRVPAVSRQHGSRNMWPGRYQANTLNDYFVLWALLCFRWWLVWCFGSVLLFSVRLWNQTLAIILNSPLTGRLSTIKLLPCACVVLHHLSWQKDAC